VRGERTFFLQPGERLENGVQDVYVLENDEGLVLKCLESFVDDGVKRMPGDRWLLTGPLDYVPPVEVEIVARRRTMPLNDNEGVYVRDTKTGKVKSVVGRPYMLSEDEELWEKPMSGGLERVLYTNTQLAKRARRGGGKVGGDVIACCVPHNGVVQLFDYKEKRTRTVFGPEFVMVEADEQFTLISVNKAVIFLKNLHASIALLFLFLFFNLLKD
jgi:major vault protein